jgi:hypothetical protein
MATAKKSAKKSTRNRQQAAARVAGKRTHDANPGDPTDSSVRHAEPSTGRPTDEGEGGYPSGEYDVTPPPANDAKRTKGVIESVLAQHFEANPGADAALKRAEDKAQLSPDQFDKAVEALPVGAIIEHEGPNRWRVHVLGRGRYGHGATQSEAVENYILGTSEGTFQSEADAALAALPSKQQKEIADRDQKAAEQVGGTSSDTFARIENAKTEAKARNAALPAANANTDGAERASAINKKS